MSERKLIVGLGNPGKDYEYTRHNLGFLIVNRFIQKERLSPRASGICKGLEAKVLVDGVDVLFLLPMVFMNNSGVAVKRFIEKQEIPLDDILVVCDDFNLEFGQLRLRKNGSDGGHNGLSSVIQQLQSQDFSRLRVGVGSPKGRKTTVDYVLENFNGKEKKELDLILEEAVQCCRAWVSGDIGQVMSQFNKRKEDG